MKSLKIVLFAGVFIACNFFVQVENANAQVFTGGEFNVNFNGNLIVDIAPMIGYKFDNLRVGVAPVVGYAATGNTSGEFSYGGKVFGEYLIYEGFFAHAEFQAINTGTFDVATEQIQRNWVIGCPVGAGYEKELMKGVFLKTMLLYDPLLDLNLDQNSGKANPSVTGGIVYQL